LAQVGREGDQLAQGEPALDREPSAHADHRGRAQIGDERQLRIVAGLQRGLLCRQLEPAVIGFVEAANLRIFLREGLDDTRAAQILLQPGRDFGQLLLDAQSQGTQLSAEVERTQREKGNDEQGQARDLRVHGEQDGDGRHREHDAFRQPQDCSAREKADALDILDRAGQQLSRFGPVVIREGERSQLVVDIAPQVVRHALRCDLGPPALEVEGGSL